MKEAQGQEMCRDLLMKTRCETGACVSLCTQEWMGSGVCFPNGQVNSCLCTFPCKTI